MQKVKHSSSRSRGSNRSSRRGEEDSERNEVSCPLDYFLGVMKSMREGSH